MEGLTFVNVFDYNYDQSNKMYMERGGYMKNFSHLFVYIILPGILLI